MEECKECLAEFVRVARNAALRLSGDAGNDIEMNFSSAIHYLEREYGTSRTVYDIMSSGEEGGVYGIYRTLARLMAEEFSQNEIGAKVSAYWHNLSVDEKLSAPDEYIEKYKNILPQKTREDAIRLKASFWKVLNDHPRIIKDIRDLKRSF
jgi:hypothetical protein